MNTKRINELAEQAGFENGHQDCNGNSLSNELEKFTKLIVQECAKSVNDWYQNHNEIHCDPMSYVLAHFGVEE